MKSDYDTSKAMIEAAANRPGLMSSRTDLSFAKLKGVTTLEPLLEHLHVTSLAFDTGNVPDLSSLPHLIELRFGKSAKLVVPASLEALPRLVRIYAEKTFQEILTGRSLRLEQVMLKTTKIPSLECLRDVRVKHLHLGYMSTYCDFSESTPCPTITGLETLKVRSRALTHLRSLSTMSRGLKRLHVDNNRKLVSLEGVAEQTSLEELFAQRTGVKLLEPVAGLTKLRMLDLRGSNVAELAPLASLKNLRWLDLQSTKVKTTDGIGGLNLEALNLANTKLKSLGDVPLLKDLRFLSLPPKVSALEDLAALQKLEGLSIWADGLDSLPLASLPSLKHLTIASTPSSPDQFPKLKRLMKKRGGSLAARLDNKSRFGWGFGDVSFFNHDGWPRIKASTRPGTW